MWTSLNALISSRPVRRMPKGRFGVSAADTLEVRNLLSANALRFHIQDSAPFIKTSPPDAKPAQKAVDPPTLISPPPTVGQPWNPMVQVQLKGKDGKNPHGHFTFDGNVTQDKANFNKSGKHYFIVSPETPHTYTQPGQYDVYLLLQQGDSFRSIKFTVNVY